MASHGKTTKMLIRALQFALDTPPMAVLICMEENELMRGFRKVRAIADAMGCVTTRTSTWSFKLDGASEIFLRTSARSLQHAENLRNAVRWVIALHDHKTSGRLEGPGDG